MMFMPSQATLPVMQRSNSEIVVPIIKNGELYGVLDIDSPIKNRFDDEDRVFLEKAVSLLTEQLEATIPL